MSNQKKDKHQRSRQIIAFGLALYRGILAIVLGIILIFNPTRSQDMLMNVMGFFWLSSGLALIRRESVSSRRIAWVVGIVAVLTGLLVVSRNITRHWLPEVAVFELLGAVILLTGVLTVLGEFRVGRVFKRRHETLQFLLGLFEIVLGLLLILSPLDRGPIIYWIATLWSLIFGGLVIGEALTQRFGKPKETDAVTQPDGAKSGTETQEG